MRHCKISQASDLIKVNIVNIALFPFILTWSVFVVSSCSVVDLPYEYLSCLFVFQLVVFLLFWLDQGEYLSCRVVFLIWLDQGQYLSCHVVNLLPLLWLQDILTKLHFHGTKCIGRCQLEEHSRHQFLYEYNTSSLMCPTFDVDMRPGPKHRKTFAS